jgi:hypothetical protein
MFGEAVIEAKALGEAENDGDSVGEGLDEREDDGDRLGDGESEVEGLGVAE